MDVQLNYLQMGYSHAWLPRKRPLPRERVCRERDLGFHGGQGALGVLGLVVWKGWERTS